MDLTLSYLLWPYGLNGIVRAELTLAYNLKILAPNTVFFAYEQNRFFVIDDARLEWLTEASSLSDAYASFQVFWNTHEGNGTGYRSPFRTPENTLELAAHEITSIPENTILFFAGIDMDGTGRLGRSKDILPLVRKSKGSIVSQLLYDMTPILFPHLHQPTTCAGYSPFVDFVANNYDHIVYGGQTCQKDAVQYYKNKDIPTPSGGSMKFGGNVPFGTASTPVGRIDDDDILRQLGITHKFVLSVGTIEPRKNHEVLYRALLSIFQDPTFKVDFQMVFVGRAGWNSNDLIETMSKDLRVKGKLIIVSPTDAQLDALYRQCEFTLLPTFYEGWSLTLPESFHHQKFCLAADVEPLKECGQQLAEYIHPLDNVLWAERIKYYLANTKALKAREAAIRKNWHPLSWREATSRLVEMLSDKWGTAQIEERKLPHE